MVWSNHPHCSEDTEESHPPQAQKFSDEDPSKEDRYIYEPLENFSKVYEEVNPNESLFSTQESDVTVNKVTKICEASPSSNHSTTDTAKVIDEKITVPMELHQEDEVPASHCFVTQNTANTVTLCKGTLIHNHYYTCWTYCLLTVYVSRLH